MPRDRKFCRKSAKALGVRCRYRPAGVSWPLRDIAAGQLAHSPNERDRNSTAFQELILRQPIANDRAAARAVEYSDKTLQRRGGRHRLCSSISHRNAQRFSFYKRKRRIGHNSTRTQARLKHDSKTMVNRVISA
jgi:hypothetical protein